MGVGILDASTCFCVTLKLNQADWDAYGWDIVGVFGRHSETFAAAFPGSDGYPRIDMRTGTLVFPWFFADQWQVQGVEEVFIRPQIYQLFVESLALCVVRDGAERYLWVGDTHYDDMLFLLRATKVFDEATIVERVLLEGVSR